FESTRSCRRYVARTPRRSRALATWLILAAKCVFDLCTAGPYATPRDRAEPVSRRAERLRPVPRVGAPPGRAARSGRRSLALQPVRARRAPGRRIRGRPRPRTAL